MGADFGRIKHKESSADFGAVDQGSYKYEDDSGARTGAALIDAATGGGMCSMMSTLCGDAAKDKKLEDDKKSDLAKAYPFRDCGLSPTSACLEYNKKQQLLRESEFLSWKMAKDADLGASLPPQDQEAFAFTAEMAKELKSRLPEGAGKLSLSQIAKQYPKEFGDYYAELQKKIPALKTIPSELALAMNANIANMSLDDLITRTETLGAYAPSRKKVSAAAVAGAGIGVLALIAGLVFAFKKKG